MRNRIRRYVLAVTAFGMSCVGAIGLMQGTLQAQVFHAIIVADVSAEAGWGELGSDAIVKDAFSVLTEIENQVPSSQLKSTFLLLRASEESHPKEVVSAIEQTAPSPDDILFLYYSGHGARDDNGQFLQLASGKLYRQEIIELMASLGARFNVLITDCCNMRLDGKQTAFPHIASMEPKTVSPLFRSLFFSQKGWVDITSSRPGEASFLQLSSVAESQRLSIFTGALCRFFSDNSKQPASWDRLVHDVSLDVAKTFQLTYPKGASVTKGPTLQLEQNVYAIAYPGMPDLRGPRSGIGVRDQAGGGVFVTNVTPGLPATRVFDMRTQKYETMRPGQVITRVNNREVTDSLQFASLVQASPQIMRLTIQQGNGSRDLLVRLQY